MPILRNLKASLMLASMLSAVEVSTASESVVQPRAVQTIPWRQDGNPRQKPERAISVVEMDQARKSMRHDFIAVKPAPIPTPRPLSSEVNLFDGNWCVPENACVGPEPISREGFSTCEEFCALNNPTPVMGLDATLYDVSCKGDWGERDYRMILTEYGDFDGTRRAAMLTKDGVENLISCSDTPAPPPDQSASQCDFNSRLYRAEPGNPDLVDQYHELQFVDGYTSGTATITEYRDGRAIWRATGEHVCSNGAVICSLLFPMTSGEVADAPFEALTDKPGDYKTIVAPSFSQSVYLSERNATMNGKSYGGLAADFLNGFVPAEGDLLLPRNVYEFAGCAP